MTTAGARHETSIGTKEWYDFVALVADLAPGIHAGGQEATRRLVRMMQLDASDWVLDVGCGPGATATLIARDVGAHVTAIDISEAMVAKARARAEREGLTDSVDCHVGDVLDIKYDTETFDAVVFESLLTIMPGDPKEAVKEMVRVLRPGGRLGGNEATIDTSLPSRFETLLERHPAIQRAFTPETLREGFEAVGLQELQMKVVPAERAPTLGFSSAFRELGCRSLLSFFLCSYPRLLGKLLFDPRFRQAQQIDEQVTEASEQYMGYALIVGTQPG